jgi:Amt family ammonium transporter
MAVDAVAGGAYDLVLMDCQMPEMDGLAATRAIREAEAALAAQDPEFRPIPIIALTANAFKDDEEHCLAAGMNTYLAKPVELQAISAAIARVRHHQPEPAQADPAPPAIGPSAAAAPPVHPAASSEQPIDVGALLVRCAGRHALAADLLDTFASSIRTTLVTLKQQIDSQDLESLARLTHMLRGSASTVSAKPIVQCTVRLSELRRQGRQDQINRGIADLEAEIERCLQYIPKAKMRVVALSETDSF